MKNFHPPIFSLRQILIVFLSVQVLQSCWAPVAPLSASLSAFWRRSLQVHETLRPPPATTLAQSLVPAPLPQQTAALSPGTPSEPIPIVLVHGFSGWGRDELAGLYYWGAHRDFEQSLRDAGFPTYTAAVGPFSSNYDRAVELYAQIKGGCVDYGSAHAARYGHAQRVSEKCYPGLYPAWDAEHPVHLMGHSMGGQTSRALAQLLVKGHPDEQATRPHASLFDGGRPGWVRSITTLSTPNRGTTGADTVMENFPEMLPMTLRFASFVGAFERNPLYNYKLEQWNLRRRTNESLMRYSQRVARSALWKASRDHSGWDLSPDGAAELNQWVDILPGIYYFSYATSATQAGQDSRWHYPRSDMNPAFQPLAFPHPNQPGIGNYTRNSPQRVPIGPEWWRNDGLVNTVSMGSPDGKNHSLPHSGRPQTGRWYHLGELEGHDHLDVMGYSLTLRMEPFFLAHAAFLNSLP